MVGGAKLLATLCTVSLVDRFGRRPLLFIGIGMMLLALLLLVVGFQACTPSCSTHPYSWQIDSELWLGLSRRVTHGVMPPTACVGRRLHSVRPS